MSDTQAAGIALTRKGLADIADTMNARPGTLVVFTAGASPEHAARIEKMGGRLIVDHGTMVRRTQAKDGNATSPARIEAAMGVDRVRAIRNHIKAVVAVDDSTGLACGWLGSPNLNRITRPEQTERLSSEDAAALLALADRVFESMPAGVISTTLAQSYAGLHRALGSAKASGARVHVGADIPLRFVRTPGVVFVDQAGMGDAVLAAARHVGRGAAIRGVTWSMDVDLASTFARRIKAGAVSSMRLGLPARFGRRKPEAAQAVADAGVSIDWTPAHAKLAVIRGPGGVVTLSGGCNFTNGGQLDAIVVRHGEDAAAEAESVMDALPSEAAPDGVEVRAQADFFSLLAA